MAPSSQALKAGDRNVTVPTGLFINNDFVEAHEKATFGIENPATGEVIIEVQEGRAEDVDIAVKAAQGIQGHNPGRKGGISPKACRSHGAAQR